MLYLDMGCVILGYEHVLYWDLKGGERERERFIEIFECEGDHYLYRYPVELKERISVNIGI